MLDWLKRLFRRERPRIYLGTLAVLPRSDLKRFLEQRGALLDILTGTTPQSLDDALRGALIGLFDLPTVDEREDPRSSDLAIDVFVPKYQSGEFLPATIGPVILPFMWRPKVTVAAHVYEIDTRATKAAYSITKKLSWSAYAKRLVSPTVLLPVPGSAPMFGADDVKVLFYKACIQLLEKVEKRV